MKDKTQTFIEKAVAIHGDTYDYTNTVYTGCMKKVSISCREHGNFEITPNKHLSSKQGCQKCSKRHRYTEREYIEAAISKHGRKYDYTETKYINNKTKVTIICRTHGKFKQLPSAHIVVGNGCKKCANANAGSYHKKDTETFILSARQTHGDLYCYSKSVYSNFHSKVLITCREHGDFWQEAASHIGGCGCPKCKITKLIGGYGEKRFQRFPELKTKPAVLYLIEAYDESEKFLKIGITTKTVEKRFKNVLPYEYESCRIISGELYNLFHVEQQIKKSFASRKYIPKIKFNGHTECFDYDVLPSLLNSIDAFR